MYGEVMEFLLAFRDEASLHPLFGIGVLLMGSFFLGRLAVAAGVPSITGFIIAGLILGPSVLGLVSHHIRGELSALTELALTVIAVVIGTEFSAGKLRKTGRAVVIITAAQMLLTFVLVTASLALSGLLPLYAAAMLGAIASATAPAATVAIIRDLKARGPFVDHLYGVVALDDAGCVLLFSAIAAWAGNSLGAGEGMGHAVLHAAREIGGSLLAGAASGLAVHFLTRGRTKTNEIYIASLGVVCLLAGLCSSFGFSPLLAGMMAGTVLANTGRGPFRVISSLEQLAPPLYATFFAIAGTELDPGMFRGGPILIMGILFILFRALGKYFGVWAGARISGSHELIRRYLGLALLPQAGVAIGLALYVQSSPVFAGYPQLSSTIVGVVLMSVFVNELTGPPVSRFAVVRGTAM
jgi:Kef-type K+ transport system membrane component KefB